MALILEGDTIDMMKTIESKTIDLIVCDLPYGSTKNRWDIIIDPVKLWREYSRIIKDKGVIVLFGSGAFSAKMIISNIKDYRYSLVWQKTTATGHLNAKKQPMRSHEDLLIFAPSGSHTYNPQITEGHERKVSTASHKRNSKQTTNWNKHGKVGYDSTSRYPKSVWTYKTDKQKLALHPTQKPVALLEQIIMTYSNYGDLVLDNTAGSGSTGEACDKTGRNCILIENDRDFILTIKTRLGVISI